jgi:hypothetical protein
MANPVNVPGDLIVPGNLRVSGSITPALSRANILAEAALQTFPIPLTDFRTWDDMAVVLPSAGANDDLGIVEGTFGSATPTLRADDHKAEGSAQTNYARVLVQLPWEYIAGNSVTLRFMAGMITTISDGTATLDVEAYKQQDDPDDAIGSDLVSEAAKSINSLTFANTDFALTATGLSPGDILDVRIATAVDDGATATAVIAAISWAKLLCDVR